MSIIQDRQRVINILQGKRFPQQRLLDPSGFAKLAEGLGVHVGYGSLETWDRIGVLHPIYRTRPDLSPLDKDAQLDAVAQAERIVCPSAENFVPWKTLKRHYTRGYYDPNPSNVYFHPFQFFRLRDVSQACQQHITFTDFVCEAAFMKKLQNIYQDELQQAAAHLRETETHYLQKFALLTLIEDKYLPTTTGWIKSIYPSEMQSYENWRDAFDAEAALQQSGLSVEQIKVIRREFAIEGEHLDPNEEWYVLLRHMSYEQRQKLKKQALLPWKYYDIAEMLGHFLEDVTKQKQPHVDDLSWHNGWKKKMYGFAPEDFDYASRNVLPNILRVFGIDPRIRVLFIVEGASEIAFIETWCAKQNIQPEPSRETAGQTSIYIRDYGIDIVPLNSISMLKNPVIRRYAQRALDEGACIVMAVDNENDAANQLVAWKTDGLIDDVFGVQRLTEPQRLPLGGLLWETCFEEANFDFEELLSAWITATRNKEGEAVSNEWLENTVEAARVADAARDRSRVTAIKVIETAVTNAIHEGRLTKRQRLDLFDKPRVAKILAESFWDADKPINQLLGGIFAIAARARIARYHSKQGTEEAA